MRIIEVVAEASHEDSIQALAEQQEVEIWWGPENPDGRKTARLLVPDDRRQAIIDALQSLLGGSEAARILIIPVEAVLPRIQAEETARPARISREELYAQVNRGGRVDGNFLALVFLSTVVASIGMLEDNLAVVIGAMVIAPLLGPNLALALATALGDIDLIREATKANLAGIGLAFGLSVVIGFLWPMPIASEELLARTHAGLDSIVLALASGAAGVLSLTSGLPAVLVGVMVAVALLPPTAASGMFLGAGQAAQALNAALLLAVNIVCVNLAAKVVFLLRGIRPRTWLEKRKARQSITLYLLLWGLGLALLVWVFLIRGQRLLAP